MKILARVVFSFLVLTGFVLYADVPSFDYAKSEMKISINYPSSLSITIGNVNRLDYIYSYKITYELPKPVPETSGPKITVPRAQAAPPDPKLINKALLGRLILFGQKNLEKWFIDNQSILDPISDLIKKNNPIENAGSITIEENEFADTLFKTGPGGAIIIEVIATPRVWGYSDQTGLSSVQATDTNGDGVIDAAEIQAFLDKYKDEVGADSANKILDHCKKHSFRIEFSRSSAITSSFGPYVSSIPRYIFCAVKNPNYIEGSTAASTKNQYVIGYQESSDFSYGIAAFWSAPIFSPHFGVSWGVAYNLQNQIDTAINGLLGVYYRNPDVPVLINFGVAVGYANTLPDNYSPNQTGIGQNETIPQTKVLHIGGFVSLSFIL